MALITLELNTFIYIHSEWMGASIWSDLWLMSRQGRLICYLALLAQIIFEWQPLAFPEFSFLDEPSQSVLSLDLHCFLLLQQVQHEWVRRCIFFPLYCTQAKLCWEIFFWNHLIVWYLDQRKKKTHSWLKIEDFIAQLCSWWWMSMVRNIFPYKSWFVNGLFLHLLFATQMFTAV